METLRHSGSTAVIVLDEATVRGGLNDVRARVDALLATGSVNLVLDVSGISRPSSTLLAALLWAHRACQRRGGRVTLRGANRRCRELLARAGLRGLFAATQPTSPAR